MVPLLFGLDVQPLPGAGLTTLKPILGLIACLSLQAQVLELKLQGGGELTIGATTYQFSLKNLSMAPAKGGLPGALKLEGDLLPRNGGRHFHLALTVLKNGALYLLNIYRRNGQAYPDSWCATLKTRATVLRLEDRPGGRIEIQCEGPLTGVIAQRPASASWSGTLWALIPGGEASPENQTGS